MPVHYYIAPVVGSGVHGDPYTLKTALYVEDGSVQLSGGKALAVYWWQTDDTGHPSSAWGLSAVRASGFTAIDNDATIDDLLGGAAPAQVDSAAAMVAFLQANALGTLSTARKNRVLAVLDKYAVNRADFTDATLLWDVLGRVFRSIFGGTDDLSTVMAGFFV